MTSLWSQIESTANFSETCWLNSCSNLHQATWVSAKKRHYSSSRVSRCCTLSEHSNGMEALETPVDLDVETYVVLGSESTYGYAAFQAIRLSIGPWWRR